MRLRCLRFPVLLAALGLAACGGGSVSTSGTLGALNGSATLNWTPVTQNTDGSALTDLAGYHVYYGTSPNAITTVVALPAPGETSYVVSNLASGTWYFAVAAYTSSGVEGVLSNIASKTIAAAAQ